MAAERDAGPHHAGPAVLPPDDESALRPARDGRAAGAAWPDTVAVALEYDPEQGDVPRVVASGKGFVAEQILTLAFEHGVRVRRDPDLAQILAQLDVDSQIPTEAFAAVAEIMAYVYKANGAAAPASAMPGAAGP